MQLNSKEYYDLLIHIKDYNPPFLAPISKSSLIFNIDLETRVIDAPKSLSIEDDHLANIIYFRVDRFFDGYDLANTIGIISYINAEGQGYIYPIPYYDIVTEKKENKIIFPWCIEGHVTKVPGPIQFAIKFYEINDKKELIYSLNTKPATSTVLKGIDQSTIEKNPQYEDLVSKADELIDKISKLEGQMNLYWIVLD